MGDTAFADAPATGTDRSASRATWSLVAGIVSVFGLFPFIQLPAAIAGLVLGIRALRSPSRKMAIAGIVLSSIGLVVMLWLSYMAYELVSHVGLQTIIRDWTR